MPQFLYLMTTLLRRLQRQKLLSWISKKQKILYTLHRAYLLNSVVKMKDGEDR